MDRIVPVDRKAPQGTTKVINEFCYETLYNEGISKNLDAVTDETLIALGKPDSLINKIYIFRIIQKLKRNKELSRVDTPRFNTKWRDYSERMEGLHNYKAYIHD
jgi:hypothetical protein